jgi:hypothetical protein
METRTYRKQFSVALRDEMAPPPLYWKYENPEGKNDSIIDNLLNKKSDDILDRNPETIGYAKENPYIITDELYDNEKIIQEEKDKEKENENKAKEKEIHEKNLITVRETGKEYFKFITKMYEDLYNQKPEEIGKFYYYLYSRSQVKPIEEDGYMYYTISKRQIIKGELQPCKVKDFVFTKRYWEQLKTKFGKVTHSDIPDMFEKIEKTVQSELECINLKTRFLNNFGIGGRTKKRNSNRKKTNRKKTKREKTKRAKKSKK